jgi:hypothetical protein
MSTTKLQAINQMLIGIGQAPVLSIDQANPEIAAAEIILDATVAEVLGEGWNFNTEERYPLMADVNGDIFISSIMLRVSDNKIANRYQYQAVPRNGRLYDMLRHSWYWTPGSVIPCDIVWLWTFEDLPQVFKNYVIQRAARSFAGRFLGSQELVSFNATDEAALRANCLAYDVTTARPNALGIEDGRLVTHNYRPFNVIAR